MKEMFLLFFPLILLGSMKADISYAQKRFDNSIVNFGVKAGLNALSSTSYEVYSGDVLLDNNSQTNKYGYLFNVFARINLDRFFMQPEIEWSHYRQELNFALPLSLEENTYGHKQTLEVGENSVILYALTGYHIVRNGPYVINCYIGGAIRANYKTEYEFKNRFSHTEYNNRRYNYEGIIGSSLNIGIIHFNIRYHFNFPNTNIKMSDIDNVGDSYQDISFKKNENILSFSCGVMF